MKNFYQNILIVLSAMALLSACELLDITPKHVVPEAKAFEDVESYQMALNNVYRNLTSSVMNMQTTDFASDDYINVTAGYAPTNYYIFNWDYQTQPQPYVWLYQYKLIAAANAVIGAYTVVPALDDTEQDKIDQIYAQALGVRSWLFFNLVQLYAPRYDGTNGNEDAIPLKIKLELEYLPKASLSEVYQQINQDIELAQKLFSESNYSPPPNLKAYQFGLEATWALQARVSLFINDMETARKASSRFISTELLSKENYWMLWEDKESTNNKEVIFMTHNLSDTDDADLIDYHEVYSTNTVSLNSDLIDSFTANDVRAHDAYIGVNNIPYKYITPINERNTTANRTLNYKFFRLAEQYLINAEAVSNSDPSEAKRIINILREKRGAELLTTPPTISEILEERRKELFSEGLRFYDLKRLSSELNLAVERKNGKVLTANSPLYIWNIPKEETNSNPYIN